MGSDIENLKIGVVENGWALRPYFGKVATRVDFTEGVVEICTSGD